MKQLMEVLGFIAFIVLAFGVVRCSDLHELQYQVKDSEPFMLHGKEWECHYTSKQVEVNILEQQIKELQNEKINVSKK